MKRIIGIVIEGKKLGRKLGFPTANIELREMLEGGVYAGNATLEGKKYHSAIFIWADKPLLEAHLLDFEGDLYGKKIEVEIDSKIRESIKFEDEDEIKKQVLKDIEIIRNLTAKT
ncbi:MAG: hypothetical protein ACD_8C00107G0004 [uncultured bacterium]|nr:MAG: hypothetical protein ACD_8C00107G0004 [uncultured bacterium]